MLTIIAHLLIYHKYNQEQVTLTTEYRTLKCRLGTTLVENAAQFLKGATNNYTLRFKVFKNKHSHNFESFHLIHQTRYSCMCVWDWGSICKCYGQGEVSS